MLDGILTTVKWSIIIALCATFMVAINGIINLIVTIVFHNVIGEVLGIMSMCLPFNAVPVFGAIGLAISGILAFLIAKKIFELTSWSILSSSGN